MRLQPRGIRDQQFFEGSGKRQSHFCGIRDQKLSRFWNQGSEIWVQNDIPGTDEMLFLAWYTGELKRFFEG